ncbi:hypothetical protein [Methylovulum psychrotolerans]|uniref:Uncharacterized protein n=1 Tax=Methylovulum psychrotolerans TaxID=1704499 RepID=A0A2S5CIW6_9GAMM|nr:hypothetical protein [Methylovulum psychrotolerans]POZ50697.1 hypothetical protein AADEFJLK_03594 [Methylovulum psychrotolerans]
MPTKRNTNLARQAKLARRAKRKKRILSFSPVLPYPNPDDLPYSNADDYIEDMDILQTAWEAHYGELSEDFMPPFYYQNDDGTLQLVEWTQTFRDLLLEKYGSSKLALVERRFKLIFQLLFTQAAEMAI